MRSEKDKAIIHKITNVVLVILVSIGMYMTMTYRSLKRVPDPRGTS